MTTAKVAGDAITTAKVAADALTGADIDEATLVGLMPGTNKAASFIEITPAAPGPASFPLSIPVSGGTLDIGVDCTLSGSNYGVTWQLRNTTAGILRPAFELTSPTSRSNLTQLVMNGGTTATLATQPTVTTAGAYQLVGSLPGFVNTSIRFHALVQVKSLGADRCLGSLEFTKLVD